MPSITIADSFDRPFPAHVNVDDIDRRTHVSGTSTEMATPPAMGYPIAFDTWNAYSAGLLNIHHVDVDLRGHRLASWEDTRNLRVEADVGDATAVHLINPIDLAICARYPGRVTSLNEHAVPEPSAYRTAPVARADKCWL